MLSINAVCNCYFNYYWLSMSSLKTIWNTVYHKLHLQQKSNDTIITSFYQLFVDILHAIHLEDSKESEIQQRSFSSDKIGFRKSMPWWQRLLLLMIVLSFLTSPCWESLSTPFSVHYELKDKSFGLNFKAVY